MEGIYLGNRGNFRRGKEMEKITEKKRRGWSLTRVIFCQIRHGINLQVSTGNI